MVEPPLPVELHQAEHLPVLGQEMVRPEEHPLVPVNFTAGHDRRRLPGCREDRNSSARFGAQETTVPRLDDRPE